jgi:hypothetical protein
MSNINEDGTVFYSSQMKQYTFVKPPKAVGWWQIAPEVEGGWSTRFAVYKKPEDHHIKNTEELLGWKWIEATND